MEQRKLFQVLVIGGALLGLGCEEEASSPPPDPTGDAGEMVAVADAAPAASDASGAAIDAGEVPASDAGEGLADAAELMNCGFCPNECCVDDGMGGQQARDGFACCWGTSC